MRDCTTFFVDGQWVALQETEKRTVASEEEDAGGVLGRLWSRVTGR